MAALALAACVPDPAFVAVAGTGVGGAEGSSSGMSSGPSSGASSGMSSGASSGGGGGPPTLWVYNDGTLYWNDDESYSLPDAGPDGTAPLDPSDTSGHPLSGTEDLRITTEPFGGWKPKANVTQDITGLHHLTIDLKTTVWTPSEPYPWVVYIEKSLTLPDTNYCKPIADAGEWTTCVIPTDMLIPDKDGGVVHVQTLIVHDNTGYAGVSPKTWYIDRVGFIP